jgi:hypothetical protein
MRRRARAQPAQACARARARHEQAALGKGMRTPAAVRQGRLEQAQVYEEQAQGMMSTRARALRLLALR